MQTAARILIADDDAETRHLIKDILLEEGYLVHTCSNGKQALEALSHQNFDVILTDIKMPGMTGLDLLLHVHRMNLDTEVILMTAYASVETAIQALRGEAFDYLPKPFSLRELRQVIRTAVQHRLMADHQRTVMHYKGLSIDQKAQRVWVDHKEIKLTRLELAVLGYLFDHQGETVTSRDLLQNVWGYQDPDVQSEDTVKSCISRLRRKLGDDAQNPAYILNVWGIGYQLGE